MKYHSPKGDGFTWCGLDVSKVPLTNREPDCGRCRKLWATPIDPPASKRIPDIKEVVDAYIACGNAFGAVVAESILAKYSPAHVLDSKCYHVAPKKRAAFIAALRRGVKLKGGKLVEG